MPQGVGRKLPVVPCSGKLKELQHRGALGCPCSALTNQQNFLGFPRRSVSQGPLGACLASSMPEKFPTVCLGEGEDCSGRQPPRVVDARKFPTVCLGEGEDRSGRQPPFS